ncbi:Linear gramicidin synthase subunit B [Photorhabdus australis subsp. thailandensis]|uniref:Linear gramicidin synthase subunit B n=1 Tax=Photorhabdus australis subsp. thailandensis TaxID=2805096 RepID=A0A1C0TYJ7_9GAMM|nr:condensation domain-containing protein [Photorhabdus australis]OCQ50738.1 Linear gramicidin synthase subunit B [Photorhabdus australis subsp. thailandensis]
MTINIAPFQYYMLECEKIFLARQSNTGILYELPSDVSDLQVKMAALGIFELFPILKSVFKKTSGEWNASLNAKDASLYFSEIECREDEQITETANRIFQDYNDHLNISEGPLAHFVLIKKDMERNLLFIGNHLVYDKLSLRNIESSMWKLLHNKTSILPHCRFLDWTSEVTHYFHHDFHKDIAYWLNTDWNKSAQLPVFQHIETQPATRKSWTVQFSHSASQYLLSSIGTSVTLIDILLAKLNLAVSEFMSSSALSVELWDNGRDSLRDRSSVGPYTSFWPLLINKSSGSLLDEAKNIGQTRATVPPKYGYLLGRFKGRNEHERRLFENIPTPQFKVNFLGHISGTRSSTKKLSRITKLPLCIPIDHLAYSHISIIFSVENGIVTMNWSHSSAAHKEEDLRQIAKIMTDMSL